MYDVQIFGQCFNPVQWVGLGIMFFTYGATVVLNFIGYNKAEGIETPGGEDTDEEEREELLKKKDESLEI